MIESTKSSILHPLLSLSMSHWSPELDVEVAIGLQECPGITKMATRAAMTDPSEKNRDNEVNRCCFVFGSVSDARVPSVGMLPCCISIPCQ